MRRAWLAPVVLAVALLVQLTVLNALHLPAGAAPDLVLILVVALAVANGSLRGMVTGFAAGLCLDLAPPGGSVIGQYALVFCLSGWAAGLLASRARRAPLRTLALAAAIIGAAEAVVAGLGLVLSPVEVTTAEVRQFLPITIGYDLLICPFALYLVVLAGALVAAPARASAGLAGSGHSALTAPARSRRAERKSRPHEPRLRPAAGRSGDGWVGGGPATLPGTARPSRRPGRLHPGAGVAGSAAGFVPQQGRRPEPVTVRLGAPRRGDGAIGNLVGRGLGNYSGPARHPGLRAGASGRFRPHSGETGGSAAHQFAPAGSGLSRARINFGAHRGETGGSAAHQFAPARSGLSRARINFGAHRDDPIAGRSIGRGWLGGQAPSVGGARVRMGASRSALVLSGRRGLPAPVPKLQFRSPPPAARRPAATPKFRRATRLRTSRSTAGLVSGGVLGSTTFRTRGRGGALPRLRLAAGRNRAGMLGGSGHSALRRPPARSHRAPRFGYGRRSLLSFLTGRRVGGRWLARTRAGSRSGPGLISKQTGGLR